MQAAPRKGYVTRQDAAAQVGHWFTLFPDPFAASEAALRVALSAAAEGRFQYWDALISGDMRPGAMLGRVRVVPAFAGAGVSPETRALLA